MRFILMCTDDQGEAFRVCQEKKATGEGGWAVAETRKMKDPPRTIYKWVVFRIFKD